MILSFGHYNVYDLYTNVCMYVQIPEWSIPQRPCQPVTARADPYPFYRLWRNHL